MRLVGVVGTATDVGKTWTTAQMITVLRAHSVRTVARKPVQSFDPDDQSPTDAEVLAAVSGESPSDVCPKHRWLPVPMAPPMATEMLGLDNIAIADLKAESLWPSNVQVGFVELVGGVRSPVTHDADSVQALSLIHI